MNQIIQSLRNHFSIK